MALFGKKTDDAPAAPTSGTTGNAPADNTFDFDAITRDLDAQNGPSSFDALLSQPVSPANAQNAAPPTSAFDTLDNDPLGLSASPNPPVNSAVPVASPDSVLNAPLSPATATPTTGVAPTGNAPAPDVAPLSPAPKAKKSLPLIPVLGVLGLVAVAIGAQMFMVNSAPPTPDPAASPPGGRPVGESAPTVSPANTATNSAASSSSVSSAPPRSPGIAPPGVVPSRAPDVAIRVPVVQKAPSATAGLDPGLAQRLKAYWKQGADAKRRGDYAAARQAWQAALQLRPQHPGFQDAIDKLPR